MAYLNLDPAYFTHLKTIRLVARCGKGSESLPIKLWAHCALHHPKDGVMLGYKQAELEALLQALPEHVEALIDVGFLDKLEGSKGFVCHDWLDHQGHLAAFKERAERGAKARWDKARKLKRVPSNAKDEPKQCLEQCPVPIRTVPSLPVTTTTAPAARVESPEMPKELDPYKTAVESWLAYKRERREGYKPTGLKAVYAKMVKLGPGLPEAVERAMANGWRGFDFGGNGQQKNLAKTSAKYDGDDSRY